MNFLSLENHDNKLVSERGLEWGVDIKWDRSIKVLSKNEKPTEKWARLKRRHFPSVPERMRSTLVPGRALEAKYTSVNLEAGKEWLKGRAGSPLSQTPCTHQRPSWTFQASRLSTSNLMPQPKASTGSSPRGHTPVLCAFAQAVPLAWNAPPPSPLQPWSWLSHSPSGLSWKVTLPSCHLSVCPLGRSPLNVSEYRCTQLPLCLCICMSIFYPQEK